MNRIDLQHISRCYDLAANSNDPSTQNGALIVNSIGDVVGEFWNRFPNGVEETQERWNDKDTKLAIVVHAESGACLNAGHMANGGTMYACWAACNECAKDIIQSGIKRLIAHDIPEHKERTDWLTKIVLADKLMEEAGIEIIRVPGKIGKKIRFSGRVIDV